MESLNFNFTVYAIDTRSLDDVKVAIEHRFGCQFRPERADRPASEMQDRYEATVFGIYFTFRPVGEWPEGRIYRLSGVSSDHARTIGAKEIAIDAHVKKLLEAAGLNRVLAPAEYAGRNRELGLTG